MRNKKAESIWQKLFLDNKFQKMITDLRENFSIPMNGFNNSDDYEVWRFNIYGDPRVEHCFDVDYQKSIGYKLSEDTQSIHYYAVKFTQNFTKVKKTKSSTSSFHKGNNFYYVVDDYIHYKKINEKELFKINTIECEFIFVEKNMVKDGYKFDEGIYIKIGNESRPSDVKLFFEQNKNKIKDAQEFFSKGEALSNRKTKNKVSKKTQRDNLVRSFKNFDIKKLNKMSGSQSTYKDINISKIMEKHGYKVKPENVRKIISRGKSNL